MAQLVARFVRIEEVRGSNPLSSTESLVRASGVPRQQVSGTTGRLIVSPLIGCSAKDRLLGGCESFEQVDLVRGAALNQAGPNSGSTCTGDIVLWVVAKEHEVGGLDA
jgi:hypothetical protein